MRNLRVMTVGAGLALIFLVFLLIYQNCSKVKIEPITQTQFNQIMEYGMTKQEVREELGKPSGMGGQSQWFYRGLIQDSPDDEKRNVIIFFKGDAVVDYLIE